MPKTNRSFTARFFPVIILLLCSVISCKPDKQTETDRKQTNHTFQIPQDYLREPDTIPDYWITTNEDVTDFLKKTVKKGQIEIIGTSAGGRSIYAVLYGEARKGKGTTTFSGSLGFGDTRAYRGPDHDKTVYLGMSAVHGGEFEGIIGTVNLIAVIETGKDLRGKEWPVINEVVSRLNRVILIPIMNPDGRARIPLRMELYRGTDFTVPEYLNTGGNSEGKITGWPEIKEFIPMDFSRPGFPGGYPNDAGVNFQHDNFLGTKQPETQALFDLAEREKPDLIINMHTGATYMIMHHPFIEKSLDPIFDSLFRYVHTELTVHGLQRTKDVKTEANPKNAPSGVYNIDGALNLHCGALCAVVESPSHAFSSLDYDGKPAILSVDMLLDGELICHQQAMKFLLETGGRSKWIPGRKE